jgi:hypothetical protein
MSQEFLIFYFIFAAARALPSPTWSATTKQQTCHVRNCGCCHYDLRDEGQSGEAEARRQLAAPKTQTGTGSDRI